MGNRILKESICVSEDIDALGWFAEVFYYRLLVNCDDYGRMDGRGSILRARLFPLREDLGAEVMEEAMEVLARRGCVRRYVVAGRPYVQVVAWANHQRMRMQRAKYPAPEGDDASRGEAAQEGDVSSQMAADGGALRPESETESIHESEGEAEAEAEGAAGDALARVAAAAAAMGMVYTRSDEVTARVLLSEHPAEWVLEAMARAAEGPSRTWRYIRGILKRWRKAGQMDARERPMGAVTPYRPVLAQMYTQREYTAEELSSLVEKI